MNYKDLEKEIQSIYESGITMSDAEALAAKFLHAQIQVSTELKEADLNSRMRKSGLKAIRAAIYLKACGNSDTGKKPTEAFLEAVISTDELVSSEQDAYDTSEVLKAELERYYDILGNGHIFARSVAKGSFGA